MGDSCRPLRGLESFLDCLSWGLRPRLYAFARFAGSNLKELCFRPLRGLQPKGTMLSPASRASNLKELCCRPLAGFKPKGTLSLL